MNVTFEEMERISEAKFAARRAVHLFHVLFNGVFEYVKDDMSELEIHCLVDSLPEYCTVADMLFGQLDLAHEALKVMEREMKIIKETQEDVA